MTDFRLVWRQWTVTGYAALRVTVSSDRRANDGGAPSRMVTRRVSTLLAGSVPLPAARRRCGLPWRAAACGRGSCGAVRLRVRRTRRPRPGTGARAGSPRRTGRSVPGRARGRRSVRSGAGAFSQNRRAGLSRAGSSASAIVPVPAGLGGVLDRRVGVPGPWLEWCDGAGQRRVPPPWVAECRAGAVVKRRGGQSTQKVEFVDGAGVSADGAAGCVLGWWGGRRSGPLGT